MNDNEKYFNRIKKVHIIGIGGIGLSAVAKFMAESGKEVSGSDLSSSSITKDLEKFGVKIYIGQSEKNIKEDTDLVIYSMAVSEENPERKKAEKLDIKSISYPQALGMIFNRKYGIAVCGTHGKSSITAMAGLILDEAGLDPSIIVGSIIPKYNSNLRIGKSKYFVVEACEYKRSFLNLTPKVIIISNIELDHTDYYKDICDVKNAFEKFIGLLQKDGILIVNGDSKEIAELSFCNAKYKNKKNKLKEPKVITFGLNKNNNVRAFDIKLENGITRFNVACNNKNLGEFTLKVPGLFNVYNSLSVISLGAILGIQADSIRESLKNYNGIWRRFEIKGEYKNAVVVSDYAHHPTAVKETIEAAKQFYPLKKMFVVFQPHQRNRTKKLFEDFAKSFDAADVLVICEIFDVAGREEKDQDISSLDLAKAVKKRITSNKSRNTLNAKINFEKINLKADSIFYAKDLKKTRKIIDAKIKNDYVLLVVGAGDIYKIADDISSKYKNAKAE